MVKMPAQMSSSLSLRWFGGVMLSVVLMAGWSAAESSAGSRSLHPPVDDAQHAALEQHIAAELEQIHAAEAEGLAPLKLGRLWAHVASEYEDELEFVKAEQAYNRSLKLTEPLPEGKLDYAVVTDNLGSLYLMWQRFEDSERCRRKSVALMEALGPGAELELARSRAHLAEVETVLKKVKEAQKESQQAYEAMVALKDNEASDVVGALSTLVYAECAKGPCPQAVEHGRKAMEVAMAAAGPDSLTVGHAHLVLGYAEWKGGVKEDADGEIREGVAIMRARTQPGHPYLINALEEYKEYLKAMHRGAEAEKIAEEQRAGVEQTWTGACWNCTVSVNSLRGR